MEKTSLLSGLILVLGLFGRTLQDDATNNTAPATNDNPSIAANGTPTGNESQGSAPTGGSPTAAADARPSGGGKCKPDEVLSDTGCVPKQDFLSKVMMESWKDENFRKVKELTGVVESTRCKPNEKRTPNGCVAPKDSEDLFKYKVPVLHSSLDGDHVVHTSYGRGFGRSEAEENPMKKGSKNAPPISAHNRPRKNYIMPGRRLRTGRICRPYEALKKDGKCVHKQGKTGIYEHRDHVYGRRRSRPPM